MQKQNWRTRMKRILLNDTGQMTVFVALIFQVLFVFFAMVINIGLIVHDKINLQNAVDLGAYYGAQRQAEILNEIAHVNYQIRQDYKLLTWRYRVLGTLGRNVDGDVPPARSEASKTFSQDDRVAETPSVCVANPMWFEALAGSTERENYCYQPYGTANVIPKIPKLPMLTLLIPLLSNVSDAVTAARDSQGVEFMKGGPWNWAFAAQILQAYKMSIMARKALIQRLRKNLVAEDFVDQNLQLVKSGVLATINKNLTLSNQTTFDGGGFKFINGLSSGGCAGSGDGAMTIAEIRTAPTLFYTYPKQINNGPTSGYIIDRTVVQDIIPLESDIDRVDPENIIRKFLPESNSPGLDDVGGLSASSLGFEKNPWCMAYVGVHARTRPRKPFAPFGNPVTLEARAFAQPFGGRIGPWYLDRWSQGSDHSDSGNRVDGLTSERYLPGASVTERLPNYSRYPGDHLGLEAKVSQAAERNLLRGYHNKPNNLSFRFFSDFAQISQTGDPLAWDPASPGSISTGVSSVRQAETIAVAPDVFDVTYYSIDSDYGQNYKSLGGPSGRFTDLPNDMFGKKINVAPDIGGRNGMADLQAFSISNQLVKVKSSDGLDPVLNSGDRLPFMIIDINHLLTGWAPNAAQNYSFPLLRYAKCDSRAKASLMIPGGCAQGGRTGYSVRLLSRDHLLTNKWSVGGIGEAPNAIRNPPPTDF